jgi:uncharacterized protein (TIGR00730 family)
MMRVCVFCSSKASLTASTFAQAEVFCDQLQKRGDGFVYGGGAQGLMGFFADQLVQRKVETIGVFPNGTFEQELAHQGLNELIYTEDMLDRKRKMMELSQVFVVFPGGIGTLDEAIEVLTWKTVYPITKPLIFFNWEGFWDPFLAMLKAYEKTGLFYPQTMDAFKVVNTVSEIFEVIDEYTG